MTNSTWDCQPVADFLRISSTFNYSEFLLTMIVINAVMVAVASCSNAVVIYTISRTPSLRTPSNILILGLAILDFCASILSQPCYCVFKFAEYKGDADLLCYSGRVFIAFSWLLVTISFLLLTGITGDRFLAIHLSLRYQSIVTTKRIITIMVVTIVVCLIFTAFAVIAQGLATLIAVVFCVLLLGLNFYFLLKIFQAVRRHTQQIQAQQPEHQSIDMTKYRKSIKIMLFIIGAFVLCYVPYVVSMVNLGVVYRMTGSDVIGHVIAETLMMFNGVLNPMIYCWRITELRNAARHLLGLA